MRQFTGALARSHQSHPLQTCLKRQQRISRNGFVNGARFAPSISHPVTAARHGNVNTARLDLPVAAEPVMAASRSSTATPAAAKTAATKPTTTYWPCKDGPCCADERCTGKSYSGDYRRESARKPRSAAVMVRN